jgi:integrase
MGKPYQRNSDGRWVYPVDIGASRPKLIYGWSEKEVIEKAGEILFEIRTGQYTPPNKDTLIAFLKSYHRIRAGYDMWDPKSKRPDKAKWEKTTAELFKMYIDVHFEPYFGNTKLKDIKTITLDTFYNFKLSNEREHKVKHGDKIVTQTMPKLSINTVIKLNKFLKAALHYAMINGKIRTNPTDGVELSPMVKYRPVVYNKDQFLKLLDFVHGKDEEVPIILGAGSGLRRGEILGLRWENVDFKAKTITIEQTMVNFTSNIEKDPKNETSKRTISAPEYVIETLQRHYVSCGKPGSDTNVVTRWKPKSLSQRFNYLLDKYNLPHIRLHDLRHYNAVVMLRGNISDKVAAERLGHSTVSTLREVYQHVLKDMDEEAANKINNSIKPNVKPEKTTTTEEKTLTREERKKMFKAI